MIGWYKSTVCRGSYALGTACGKCEKCVEQKEQFAAKQSVNAALNTPSSALKEIRELKERVAELSLELDEARHHRHELASTWRDRAEKAEAKLAQVEQERDEARNRLNHRKLHDAPAYKAGFRAGIEAAKGIGIQYISDDLEGFYADLAALSPTDTVRQAALHPLQGIVDNYEKGGPHGMSYNIARRALAAGEEDQ